MQGLRPCFRVRAMRHRALPYANDLKGFALERKGRREEPNFYLISLDKTTLVEKMREWFCNLIALLNLIIR